MPIASGVPAVASATTTVAFIADQGVSSGAKAVLSMIKEEGADIVLIQGDLGYERNTAVQWEQNLTDHLGRDFPVLSLAGNHEQVDWGFYKQFIDRRIERAEGLSCIGNPGIKANCTFGNLQVVQVAQGVREIEGVKPDDNYDGFIRSAFNGSDTPWKVCAWHKNQRAIQAYSKSDETGWDIYDACLDSGAMIAMGHAHTYSRTHLMEDYRSQRVAHRDNDMLLEPGRSLAVVSGLGGRDIKPQENYGDWFASIYTKTQGATHGALFCQLEQARADCYFKAVDGSVPDRFTLRTSSGMENTEANDSSSVQPSRSIVADTDLTDVAGVFRRTDKNEYRWIARDNTGQLSSRWISENCAAALGGERNSGNWSELIEIAPGIDTMLSPCDNTMQTSSPPPPQMGDTDGGFVYSRTDKAEYRWVDHDEFGSMGNIWIDEECANRLGGATVSGDWYDLNDIAPGFDTLISPCY